MEERLPELSQGLLTVEGNTKPLQAKSKNIAVFFGDETFPRVGRGHSERKWQKAVSLLAKVLYELEVKYLYIPSYKGTNLAAAAILDRLKIPYTLIIPHPSFGGLSSTRQKLQLAEASSNAHRTIILGNDTGDDLLFDVQETYKDLVEYIERHCNSLIVAHDENPTDKFVKLLNYFDRESFKNHFSFTY